MNRTTSDVVTRQAEAMGVEVFEVGLYKPAVEACPNEPEMLPRTWDKATLLKSIGWLKHQNSHGRNIYIRPKGEHALSLVDDLTATSIKRLKDDGFSPAIIVETSPGNFQAWLNHGRILPKAESTAAARALAEKYGGDRGAADWRHFGRLAGLTNRKPKYAGENGLFPFVRLVESSGLPYAERERFVAEIGARLEKEPARAAVKFRNRAISEVRAVKSIEVFRANPVYAGDNTRIDLAYAIYALSHGYSENDVRQAIRSRDLSHKGTEKRQEEYIERTVKKANALLSPGVVSSVTRSR